MDYKVGYAKCTIIDHLKFLFLLSVDYKVSVSLVNGLQSWVCKVHYRSLEVSVSLVNGLQSWVSKVHYRSLEVSVSLVNGLQSWVSKVHYNRSLEVFCFSCQWITKFLFLLSMDYKVGYAKCTIDHLKFLFLLSVDYKVGLAKCTIDHLKFLFLLSMDYKVGLAKCTIDHLKFLFLLSMDYKVGLAKCTIDHLKFLFLLSMDYKVGLAKCTIDHLKFLFLVSGDGKESTHQLPMFEEQLGALNATANQRYEQRKRLFTNVGPCRRALCARRDIMIRKQLRKDKVHYSIEGIT